MISWLIWTPMLCVAEGSINLITHSPWANVDPDRCCHMALPGHNELRLALLPFVPLPYCQLRSQWLLLWLAQDREEMKRKDMEAKQKHAEDRIRKKQEERHRKAEEMRRWGAGRLHKNLSTNDISIEFEIRPIFAVLWFKMYSTDHEILHTSRQYNCRDVCKISLWSVEHVVGFDHGLPCRVKNMARGTQ